MDRMLVVVFGNETKAYEGKKALLQLDNEGSISVYGYAVVAKNADGTASIKQDVVEVGAQAAPNAPPRFVRAGA